MGLYEYYELNTAHGPRKQYFQNSQAVRSSHIPDDVKQVLKHTAQQGLHGGVVRKHAAVKYKKPSDAASCRGRVVEALKHVTVNQCFLTDADYRSFLKLIISDRYKEYYKGHGKKGARFTEAQYLAALDKQLTSRIPKQLQQNPCTKITAFVPQAPRLPAQGNYEFMPKYAKLGPSLTKTNPYWRVVKKIGEGAFGSIYMVANSEGQNFAIKIQIETPGEESGFITTDDEVRLQNFFAKLNLAPEVVGFTSIELSDPKKTNVKIIVMETVDMTLDDLLCQPNVLPSSWVNAVAEQIKTLFIMLHKYGITHGDLHPGNIGIMYNPRTKELKLRLIDFGQSSNRSNNPEVDALQLLNVMREFMGVPANILRVFTTKVTEALTQIRANAKLPSTTRANFIKTHRLYEKTQLGYTARKEPAVTGNFPAWFKA